MLFFTRSLQKYRRAEGSHVRGVADEDSAKDRRSLTAQMGFARDRLRADRPDSFGGVIRNIAATLNSSEPREAEGKNTTE